jgi:diguanylate cyclase (GGDEF)-like protein
LAEDGTPVFRIFSLIRFISLTDYSKLQPSCGENTLSGTQIMKTNLGSLLMLCLIFASISAIPLYSMNLSNTGDSSRVRVDEVRQDLEMMSLELQTKRLQLENQELGIQRTLKWLFMGLTCMVLVFAILFYLQSRVMRNAKRQLECMNREVMLRNEQLNKAYQELEEIARQDPLTKLSNRRDMVDRLDYERNRANRSGRPFCIAMADIDHFKKVNDTYGHDAGDTILEKVSELMTHTMRRQDIVSRWGGEEFLVLMPETDLEGSTTAMEKVRETIEETVFHHRDDDIRITITIGISQYSEQLGIDETIKHADLALYNGKTAGRNRIIPFLEA